MWLEGGTAGRTGGRWEKDWSPDNKRQQGVHRFLSLSSENTGRKARRRALSRKQTTLALVPGLSIPGQCWKYISVDYSTGLLYLAVTVQGD